MKNLPSQSNKKNETDGEKEREESLGVRKKEGREVNSKFAQQIFENSARYHIVYWEKKYKILTSRVFRKPQVLA